MSVWHEDRSNQSTDTTMGNLLAQRQNSRTDSRTAWRNTHASALMLDGTLGNSVSGTSAPQSKQRMRRAHRGGVASPTVLPRLPSSGVGGKKTGRSLGRRWARVGVGELQMTCGGRRKEGIRSWDEKTSCSVLPQG